MHQGGRDGVTKPLFREGRDALRRVLYKTGFFQKNYVLLNFLGMASKSQSMLGGPGIAAKCAGFWPPRIWKGFYPRPTRRATLPGALVAKALRKRATAAFAVVEKTNEQRTAAHPATKTAQSTSPNWRWELLLTLRFCSSNASRSRGKFRNFHDIIWRSARSRI